MKPLLSLTFLMLFIFLSCSKNNNTPPETDPPPNSDTTQTTTEDSVVTKLEAHTWLLDSLEKFHNGVVVDSLIEPSPKIEMRYTDDHLYFSYPGGVQNDPYLYEVKDGNKIYRWREGDQENEYFIIQQLTDKNFVLSTHDQEFLEYDYYSAK